MLRNSSLPSGKLTSADECVTVYLSIRFAEFGYLVHPLLPHHLVHSPLAVTVSFFARDRLVAYVLCTALSFSCYGDEHKIVDIEKRNCKEDVDPSYICKVNVISRHHKLHRVALDVPRSFQTESVAVSHQGLSSQRNPQNFVPKTK